MHSKRIQAHRHPKNGTQMRLSTTDDLSASITFPKVYG